MLDLFQSRESAGRLLGEKLATWPLRDPLILGIPRGGVVTAAAMAERLGADMDVVLAHKLRAPHQPELAIGAIGEDGEVYLNPRSEGVPGVTPAYLEGERQKQLAEIQRRRQLYRGVQPAAAMEGRSVIITDDGMATGSTMFAALEVAKSHQPHELIVAVPVAPAEQLPVLHEYCDHLIALHAPATFWSVGQFYESFAPVSDDQVVKLLRVFAEVKSEMARS